MRLELFSNSFSLEMFSVFRKNSLSGLKVCPGWLVTTGSAVEVSRNTAALWLSPYKDQSAGTATWQAFLESLTICQPAGTTWAETHGRPKSNSVGIMYALLPALCH